MKKTISLIIIFLFSISGIYSQSDRDTTNKRIIIGILPIGGIQDSVVRIVRNEIEKYYKFTVKVFDKIDFPDNDTLFSKDTIKTANVLTFLHQLRDEHSKCDLLIGITNRPIIIETMVGTFVHRGMTSGTSSIISSFRIQKDAENDEKIFAQYLAKVALHEIGHFFGLMHCSYSCKCFMIGLNYCTDCPDCVRVTEMNDIKSFYASDNELCPECKKILNLSIQRLINEKKQAGQVIIR